VAWFQLLQLGRETQLPLQGRPERSLHLATSITIAMGMTKMMGMTKIKMNIITIMTEITTRMNGITTRVMTGINVRKPNFSPEGMFNHEGHQKLT
jgi:hypothetical protein